MARSRKPKLSRRESEMMDIIYALGRATAVEVRERMVEPPSYSAVRATLRILEEKGHLSHEQDGPRYIYLPTIPREAARKSAVRHLVDTFFEGSAHHAVAALIDLEDGKLSEEELDRLSAMIARAKKEGR
ncbi:MAG: BlaI/MecI/CopY family transcriptional regulator [Phycisphaerales bacterium]|nr:BlaI/MecI/CopY family transcriptional regulator [Phycisphaerales bacterium]